MERKRKQMNGLYKVIKRFIKQVAYKIRYKYYRCYNFLRNFRLGDEEAKRQALIDSIEELKNK